MRIDINRVPGLPQYNYVGGRPTMIVMHETANPSSTLDNERNYMANNWGNAFFHYLVDADHAVELANPNFLAWGAGPQANPYAIHIELVRNTNFSRAYANYVELARILADRYGIPKVFNRQRNGIVTHHWVSQNMGGTDHTDPDSWLSQNGVSLDKFKNDIERGATEMVTQNGVNYLFRSLLGRTCSQEQSNQLMAAYTFDQCEAWVKNLPEYKDKVAKAQRGELNFRDYMMVDFRDKLVDANTKLTQGGANILYRSYLGISTNDYAATVRIGKQTFDEAHAEILHSDPYKAEVEKFKADPTVAYAHLPQAMREAAPAEEQ